MRRWWIVLFLAAAPATADDAAALVDAEDGLGGGLDSVEALGTLGPPAKEAVPLLRILLAEARTGAQVRIVRWALAEIEG